ncbi:Na/Pi cotransporter family protein [Desulfurivibrio alkaliphilus]|uniref:Na+/Picotransporter n=1 Tax=Desulfurivibrio alkaliphilus (strain DSM 19089 / UNIQEM U267 / AHT2) TaxID=589865 RepID=D6Z627_DESAT|nr:Na/Pi symporter [Desulfurivibrio alkaliphilus]ADH84909.1 Na+/Picotransporter [Desulfurivibrio alkaliphilus AHT 2]
MGILEQLDIWRLLAGLGIFLFGMYMLEESIRLLAGRAFKSLIRRYTGTRLRGIVAGAVSTSILQSSSAVSLMVLAFTGAGLMTLVNAQAVMIGAMVGTTMTTWIVAVFGFKIKIEAFALPMIAVGGLGLILSANSPRYVNLCKLLVGFGFLFHGLDFMKSSVEGVAAAIDIAALPDLGLWIYLLAGLLMTVIMQSSSATNAITLTMLFSGVVDFSGAGAMVIGANVGTTVTVLIASLGGIAVKRQAALGQLIYISTTALVAYTLLPLLTWLVLEQFRFADNPVLGLALFHTLYNVVGVMVFFPLIPRVTAFVRRRIPEPVPLHLTLYITKTSPEVPEAAIEALRKEAINQARCSMDFVRMIYGIDPKGRTRGRVTYDDLERMHAEIFTFYARIQTQQMEEAEARRLEPYIRASRSIMNATKNFFEQNQEIDELRREDQRFMHEAWQRFLARLQNIGKLVENIGEEPEVDHTALLEQSFAAVEEEDRNFIRACATEVASRRLQENEVTRLLMSNRLFTQSCRMLVLSLQSLNLAVAAPEQET